MKARMGMTADIRSQVRKLVEQEQKRQLNDVVRKIFKLMCVELNDDFEFGKKRLSKLISNIENTANKNREDEIFWEHIDKVCIDQIGMEFEREKDYE